MKDPSCPRPAGFRLCYRSADKESHRTAEAPPASTQPQNGEILRRGERHFVSAAEHASRPRLFFCASSPVSKKAIEWPPSGTKIKKLRNGESPLSRPLGHRMEKTFGAMRDTSCPRPLGHRTEKSSGAMRDTSCPRWNTLRVRVYSFAPVRR